MLPFDEEFPEVKDLNSLHVYASKDNELEEMLKDDLVMSALLRRCLCR